MYNNDKLTNLIRSQAAAVLSAKTQTRIGTVTTFNPNNYTATVLIQPEEILTGELPILSEWVGNGWGFYAPPSINDMVVVHFQEDDFSSGIIGQRLYNINQRPIQNVPIGEFWLQHETGSFVKLKNDGTVEITMLDTNGNPTNLNIAGNIVVTGNITATGNILDNSLTNTRNVKGMRTIFNAHIHPTPSGLSSAPTTNM